MTLPADPSVAGRQDASGAPEPGASTPVAVHPRSAAGLAGALIAGLVVTLGLGLTLLTWALSLMFMLGLFFFMLFGLLVGACMFRFGSGTRPLPRRGLIAVTALVALVGWFTAIGKECVDFPDDFVERAVSPPAYQRQRVYVPPGSGEYEKVRAQVRTFIGEHLARTYPPGGALGYLRYTWSGDAIELDIPNQPRKVTIMPRVAPWVWWVRVLLALPLYFLTMYSVTSGLARLPDAAELRRKY